MEMLIHPVIGREFNGSKAMWQVIIDSPRSKHLVSYPASGCALYTFAEAVKVLMSFEARAIKHLKERGQKSDLDYWLECPEMRMDIEAVKELTTSRV